MATFVGADKATFTEMDSVATATLNGLREGVENSGDVYQVLDALVSEIRGRYAAPSVSAYDVLLAAFRLGQQNPSATAPAEPAAPAPTPTPPAEPAS